MSSSIQASRAAKSIIFNASKLARFSDGSCTCTLGDTSVLVTAVSVVPDKPPTAASFVPLNVDYRQKAAAAGRIPTTHLRRDIGITEKETLTARMIDRSIRPGFQRGFYHDTQIVCNLLAADASNDPDVLAINGASASLSISDIPWNGPVGAVRVGLIKDSPVTNPTRSELKESRVDMVLTANQMGNILMIDGGCKEPVLLTDLQKVIKFGIKECKAVIESIKIIQKHYGKPKRSLEFPHLPSQEQVELVNAKTREDIIAILRDHTLDKVQRGKAMDEVRTRINNEMRDGYPGVSSSIWDVAFSDVLKMTYREYVNTTSLRCDGRKIDEIRKIDCKVDLYKPLHGSALFQRGQTQVFCSATYDSPDAAFRNDSMTLLTSGVKEKNFMLHYEFPPFATNEIGRVGALPGRREIGHGNLAERSIRPLVPDQTDMTIRLNCEVLESNGSSSMASICAGSMALMDAGVKIPEHVAGVAMGLMSDFGAISEAEASRLTKTSQNYNILTDILGLEDYLGDMDFKIAGTRKGVSAMQLDVKPMFGVPPRIIYETLQKAHWARSTIIGRMEQAIKIAREEKKPNHPVIKTIFIPNHKRSSFVGFGGSNLKKMFAETGVRITSYDGEDSEGNEVVDNFMIFAPNRDAMAEADEYIQASLEKRYHEPELEFNAIYNATIIEIRDNGVMVSLYPDMIPTLLPLSQLDVKTVRHPSALNLEVGQILQVKYFGRDPASGQMRLSRKSLQVTGDSRVYNHTNLDARS